MQISLKNESESATALDVGAELITGDPLAMISPRIGHPQYGDIPAGTSATTSAGAYLLEIGEDHPVDSDVIIDVSILSEGYSFWSDSFAVHVEPEAGIADRGGVVPRVFALHQNSPNPFNPVTVLRYDLPRRSDVSLTVYDILGRRVRTLVRGVQSRGYKSVRWDGTDDAGGSVGAGVYLVRLSARGSPSGKAGQGFTQTRKMVLLR